MIENRLVGIKSREIYETPAAALLMAAYAGVEELVCERDLAHTKQQLALQYATLVYNGLWFSPLRLALQAFMEQATAAVTGTARVKLFKGNCGVVGRTAPGVAVRPRPGHLRGGRPLPARRRRRLHPRLVAGHQDLGGGDAARRIQSRCEPLRTALVGPPLRRPRPRHPRLHGVAGDRPPAAALRPAGERGARAHAGPPGPDRRGRGGRDRRRAGAGRDRAGRGRRGRALRDRAAAGRARPARARRPQPQRPGADGDAAVGEGGLRRAAGRRAAAWPATLLDRADAGRRRRAARLHPRPARAAGVAGPAPGRARLGAAARRPPAGPGARGGRRLPAGRRRAGRLQPAARPGLDGRAAGLRPPASTTRSTPSPTATT